MHWSPCLRTVNRQSSLIRFSSLHGSLTRLPISHLSSTSFCRMASTLPKLPLFDAIARHNPDSTLAVHSLSGRTFKYGELLGDVCKARNKFQQAAGKEDLNGDRIAFLVENSYDYVGTFVARDLGGFFVFFGLCFSERGSGVLSSNAVQILNSRARSSYLSVKKKKRAAKDQRSKVDRRLILAFSHPSCCVRRPRDSYPTLAGVPGCGAAVHPRSVRGFPTSIFRQVCEQGVRGAGHRAEC